MALTVKSKPSDDPIELDVKRFYLPGTVLSSECPKCKKTIKKDLGRGYLSYPVANAPIDEHFYCPDDESEWNERIILRITVEAAPSEKPTTRREGAE